MTHPQLPGALHKFLGINIESILNHYGYAAVIVCVAFEATAIPLPGEIMLIAASVYAGAGSLNIFLVALAALVAALVGDNVGFWVGHAGGRRLLDAAARKLPHLGHGIARVDGFYERFGGRVVAFARFIEGARQANGIIAGSTGLRWRIFVVYDAAGAVAWVALWTTLGYYAGQHINTVYSNLTTGAEVLAALVVVGGIAYFLVRRRRGKQAGSAEHGTRSSAPSPALSPAEARAAAELGATTGTPASTLEGTAGSADPVT